MDLVSRLVTGRVGFMEWPSKGSSTYLLSPHDPPSTAEMKILHDPSILFERLRILHAVQELHSKHVLVFVAFIWTPKVCNIMALNPLKTAKQAIILRTCWGPGRAQVDTIPRTLRSPSGIPLYLECHGDLVCRLRTWVTCVFYTAYEVC